MEWSACLNFEMDKDALGELEEYDMIFVSSLESIKAK
jgi:hypothetical protein